MEDGALLFSESLFSSRLSFRPLIDALKKNIKEGNPGMQKLYGQVVAQFESHSELMAPIDDLHVIAPHAELIQELLSAVFPPTTANQMYGISLPFDNTVVYASPVFKAMLLKPGTNEINTGLTGDIQDEINREKLHFAYNLLLKEFLHCHSPETSRSVYPVHNANTQQTRFLEVRLDGRFIDVKPKGEMPQVPPSILNHRTGSIMTLAELMEKIPLDKFVFEGVMVIRVNDTTEAEVITKIKNRLLDINTFSDASVYTELEGYVQSLVGLKDISIGITPFFKLNGHYVY